VAIRAARSSDWQAVTESSFKGRDFVFLVSTIALTVPHRHDHVARTLDSSVSRAEQVQPFSSPRIPERDLHLKMLTEYTRFLDQRYWDYR